MDWIEALILGLVQGLTEYLPVSSSGHLTIGREILGLNTSGSDNLIFDTLVHAATVLSTIVILRKEICRLAAGTFSSLKWNAEKEYVGKIIVSMIPIFIVGMFFKDQVEAIFGQGLLLVGICLMITAMLLSFAFFAKPRQKDSISWRDSFVIGLSQVVAVLPGLSRSGTTIATGLILGNKKESVAQFSFLMVIVPILGEALLNSIDLIKDPGLMQGIGLTSMLAGFFSAFVAGCLACKFMLNIIKRGKIVYFAIYCAIAGVVSVCIAL